MIDKTNKQSGSAGGRAAIVILVVAMVVFAAGPAVLLTSSGGRTQTAPAPSPEEQAPKEVLAYLASEDFARRPLDERREYLRVTGEAKKFWSDDGKAALDDLSDGQRERFKRNVGEVYESKWRQERDRYFELPPAERVAYLDQIIDDLQAEAARKKEPAPKTQAKAAEKKNKRGKGFGPEGLRAYIVTTDRAEPAKDMEFKNAYRQRMRERGIPN
ncbi:MAG: hypothetical protein ACYS8X_03705 [Planctomycetota bacterium]|jgi:hypothetical protein